MTRWRVRSLIRCAFGIALCVALCLATQTENATAYAPLGTQRRAISAIDVVRATASYGFASMAATTDEPPPGWAVVCGVVFVVTAIVAERRRLAATERGRLNTL